MKFNETLINFVTHDITVGKIPMLLGEPGIGKSSWVEGLAKSMRTEVFILPCNQLADKTDLTGARLVPENNTYKQVFYPHAVISDAIKYAQDNPREKPILFLDEINRTTPDVTSALLSIPTLRAIGSTKLPDNLRIVCAGNDKGNVTSLDEASITRFVFYKTTPDVNTFLSLDKNLNPYIKTVLTQHPNTIFCKTINTTSNNTETDDDLDIDDILLEDDGMHQITTPRTISGLSDWLNSFTQDELLSALSDTEIINNEPISTLQIAIEGHVGNTLFAQYLLAELSSVLTTSTQTTTSLKTPTKPACYDELQAAATRDELSNIVASLSDKDLSGCLIYAIYEPKDNETILAALTGTCKKLTDDDAKMLLELAQNNKLDKHNVTAFLDTNSQVADGLSTILQIYAA